MPIALVAWRAVFPSVTPYTSLFSLSALVYLQHLHVYVPFRSTRSTSVIIMFSLSQQANPHHPQHISSSLIISHNLSSNSVCTVAIHFAPPSSLPCAAVGYSMLASSPWAPFWLTGLGVKPCIRYSADRILAQCWFPGLSENVRSEVRSSNTKHKLETCRA